MSSSLTALFLGLAVAGWSYAQLAKRNGNANPSNNAFAAIAAGIVSAIVMFTILKFILNF